MTLWAKVLAYNSTVVGRSGDDDECVGFPVAVVVAIAVVVDGEAVAVAVAVAVVVESLAVELASWRALFLVALRRFGFFNGADKSSVNCA